MSPQTTWNYAAPCRFRYTFEVISWVTKSLDCSSFPLSYFQFIAAKWRYWHLVLGETSGYWHYVLSEKSSYLTTFQALRGRLRWLGLPFGLILLCGC